MEETSTIESALVAISARKESLSDSERKVAEYVLHEPKKTLHFNVSELARQSGSSQAAVVRFCKRIGLGSFNNFKLRLARDVFRDYDERFIPDLDLESETSPERKIQSVIASSQQGLSLLGAILDPKSVELAADRILGATMTVLFGVGASGVVAYDFLQKLLRVGLPSSYTADTDLQVTAATSLKPTDVAFVVSYSGENTAMGEAARQAKGPRRHGDHPHHGQLEHGQVPRRHQPHSPGLRAYLPAGRRHFAQSTSSPSSTSSIRSSYRGISTRPSPPSSGRCRPRTNADKKAAPRGAALYRHSPLRSFANSLAIRPYDLSRIASPFALTIFREWRR